MTLKYEAELKNKLIEYAKITENIDNLTSEKNKIRTQIKQWLEMNELDEAFTCDPNDQWWKIAKQISNRKKVVDWPSLRMALGSNYDDVVTEATSESFVIKKVKAPKE